MVCLCKMTEKDCFEEKDEEKVEEEGRMNGQ